MDSNTILLKISCKNGLIGKFTAEMEVRLDETWVEVVSKPPIRGHLTEIMKDTNILTSVCGIHSSSKSFEWAHTVGGSLQRNYSTPKWELNVIIRKRADRNLFEYLNTPEFGQGDSQEGQNTIHEHDTVDEGENSDGLQIDAVTGGVEAREIVVTKEGNNVVKIDVTASDFDDRTDVGIGGMTMDDDMDTCFRELSPTPTEATSFFHDAIDHEKCERLKEKFCEMPNEHIQYLINGCKVFIGGNISRQMKNDARYPQLATFLRALFQENGSGGSMLYDDSF